MPKAKTIKRPIRPFEVVKGLLNVAVDKENTGDIFRIISAVSGSSMAKPAARFARTETGQKSIADMDRLLAVLKDQERLKKCPEGSLGRAYLDFVYGEGLTADGLTEASTYTAGAGTPSLGAVTDEEVALANRIRDMHDLWHVTTGYGRDVVGEVSILSFTYAQVRNPGVALIVLLGTLVVPVFDRKIPIHLSVLEAFVNGLTANWLPAEEWEELLDLPLAEVRGRIGLSRPRTYQRVKHRAQELEMRIRALQQRVQAIAA
ncbi:MAG: Coq4 family protein [Alphaproteobacteria bacterium]